MVFRWIRHFVRRHTRPIPIEKAESTKKKLAIFYAVVAWHAFGFVCYMIYTGRGDWAHYYGYKSESEAQMPPAQQWARTLKIEKAKIIRMSGFHKVQEYDYCQKEESTKENAEETY